MGDTFSSHFETKKFDRVGRRGQKQLKLGIFESTNIGDFQFLNQMYKAVSIWRLSCTQLMLTTFARSSGHFLKSKRLKGFLPSTNTSELPKSPRSLQRLIYFPLFHDCKNCKCFSLSKFHMLIIIFVEILDWKYKDTAALCSDWLVMTISG